MRGISVIIPTFNREKLVGEAIKSVLYQDYGGVVEIIISDDGSTDKTLEVVSNFGSKIKILIKPDDCHSQGASGARNRGILKATQPYICFLDSDDLYLPGHLKKMVAALESNDIYSFALCNSLEMLELNNTRIFRRWTKEKIGVRDLENLAITTINFANSNGFIFKRRVFNKIGLFNEKIQVGEDTDMWMRVNENFKGVYSNHYGTVIRRHNMLQLTDIPKSKLRASHYAVYRNAIKRYQEMNLNNNYRLTALWFLAIKYKLSLLPVFSTIYIYLSDQNNRKKNEVILDSSWQPLEFFEN